MITCIHRNTPFFLPTMRSSSSRTPLLSLDQKWSQDCQAHQPVWSTAAQSGVFWALYISFRALPPCTLPTMPSCLLRLHQIHPSATTKVWASLRGCQQCQPVTASLNHKIMCRGASVWKGFAMRRPSYEEQQEKQAFRWLTFLKTARLLKTIYSAVFMVGAFLTI